MTLKIQKKKKKIRQQKKDKTINEYASLISEMRKECNTLYKENQDSKAEMQNLRNYCDREKLISHNKKKRNFQSYQIDRYQRSYENSSNEETGDEEKYYVYPKNKKPRKKYYDDMDGDYDDVDDDIDDYTDDEEFIENDNYNNENDEKCNKNINNKKVIQEQKQKPKNQNKKGISKSIKV